MYLPASFINSLQNVQGFSPEAFEEVHVSGEQVTSIRIHPFKWQHSSLPLTTYELQAFSAVPWCVTGRYLSERPSFILDPLWHAGCYYVQEASSMFLEQVVKTVCPGHASAQYKVLDLCAAPGGKSTHLSALFPQGLVVANEVIKTRVGTLVENAVKWGMENMVVTSNDATDFKGLQGYFDLIVADAPCSGSGMFRKDPAAVAEWSLQNVAHCSKRQQRIIHDIWPALKENGVFIYSTCSYSAEENEAVLDWIAETFEAETIPVALTGDWGIVETVSERKGMYGYRFYPDKLQGEGFFIACMRKKSVAKENIFRPEKFSFVPLSQKAAIAEFVTSPNRYACIRLAEEVVIIPAHHVEEIAVLASILHIKKMGIKAGRLIRDELLPAHDLAVSILVTKQLKTVETGKEMALDYLGKKDIFPDNATQGWNVVQFMGRNLGWVKILPNRVNNYYPSAYRILKR